LLELQKSVSGEGSLEVRGISASRNSRRMKIFTIPSNNKKTYISIVEKDTGINEIINDYTPP
jgi:hypothetical protein